MISRQQTQITKINNSRQLNYNPNQARIMKAYRRGIVMKVYHQEKVKSQMLMRHVILGKYLEWAAMTQRLVIPNLQKQATPVKRDRVMAKGLLAYRTIKIMYMIESWW